MLKTVLVIGALFLFGSIGAAQTPNLFKQVNSVYNEQNPIISPDGNELYVTVAKHPQNRGGVKDEGDIWISTKREGIWQPPVHGGNRINDTHYNGVAGFSADGDTLFLLSHYSKNENVTTQGIAFSKRTSSGWSTPENISIPYFLNRSPNVGGAISANGTILILSTESYGTAGAEDIYVSIKQDGKWQEPINLGSVINTPSEELTPSLSADTKTLYFASNGRNGFGSFDIFSSDRLDDTWKNWSAPKNMGGEINSEGKELYYHLITGGTLFTSTKDSDGYGDIHRVSDDLNTDTLVNVIIPKKDQFEPGTILISGKVTNAKTGSGVAAKLQFKSDTLYTVLSLADGAYAIRIKRSNVYSIEIEKKGYVNLSERIDLQTIKLESVSLNFKLQAIEVGTLVNLKNVLFNMGTTTLLEESYPELDAVVSFLKTNSKVEIQLEGHTDNRGDAEKNLVLSQERVEKIKSYLVSKGIASRRIKGKGYGGSKPIASGDTEDARRLNRRVEFLIVKS